MQAKLTGEMLKG